MASCRSSDAERIRQLAAVLLRPKPRQQDLRPFHSEWQVSRWQDGCKKRSDKQPRLLPEVIREFQNKIIKAAQKLQQQLSDGAEQPTSTAVEQSARMDTTDGVDSDANPMLTRLKARQSKRAQDIAAEEQRPLAKAKVSRGRNKRTAATSSDSVEQPVPKRKERLLTSQLFALGACDPSDPSVASPDSAVQSSPVRQQSQIMCRLLYELRKLSSCAWVVGDADVRCKAIIRDAFDLQKIAACQRILKKRSITVLYSGICGKLAPVHDGPQQDYTHVSLTASMVVERKARQFVQGLDEIEESRMDDYPCLWELKNRQHDAALNGLPAMPTSPHQLFEILNDTEASASTPFGRLPADDQAGPPFLKVALPLMEAFYETSASSWVSSELTSDETPLLLNEFNVQNPYI